MKITKSHDKKKKQLTTFLIVMHIGTNWNICTTCISSLENKSCDLNFLQIFQYMLCFPGKNIIQISVALTSAKLSL